MDQEARGRECERSMTVLLHISSLPDQVGRGFREWIWERGQLWRRTCYHEQERETGRQTEKNRERGTMKQIEGEKESETDNRKGERQSLSRTAQSSFEEECRSEVQGVSPGALFPPRERSLKLATSEL